MLKHLEASNSAKVDAIHFTGIPTKAALDSTIPLLKKAREYGHRADSLLRCGDRHVLVHDLKCGSCGGIVPVKASCHQRICPDCEPELRKQEIGKLTALFEAVNLSRTAHSLPLIEGRLLTITVRSQGTAAETLELLLRSWARLRATKFGRRYLENTIAKIEFTWTKEHGFHPHLHVVVDRFIPFGNEWWDVIYEELLQASRMYGDVHRGGDFNLYEVYGKGVGRESLTSAWWHATRGEGEPSAQNISYRRGSQDDLIRELSKYLAKELPTEITTNPALYAEYYQLTERLRTLRTTGDFYAVPAEFKCAARCPHCGQIGSLKHHASHWMTRGECERYLERCKPRRGPPSKPGEVKSERAERTEAGVIRGLVVESMY